jgi:hypothetical protein
VYVDRADQARFVWRSEEWLPCGPGSTSRGLPIPNMAVNGNLGSPIYHDGTIYTAGWLPAALLTC